MADKKTTWSPAPLPPNEAQRLKALARYNILDTPPEEMFDRITQLAARMLKAPVALISLVDEKRQWFKSHYGTEEAEAPRDVAFCAHALLGNEVLVVPNATKDPKFASNPMVMDGPKVRFYAGAPLRTNDGYNLGTLCVIDQKEHEDLTGEDRATLQYLADMVIDAMELRIFTRKATMFESVVKHSRDAVIIARGDDDDGPEIVYANPSYMSIIGYAHKEAPVGSPRLLQGVATSRAQREWLKTALASEAPFPEEIVNQGKGGRQCWFMVNVYPIPDVTGDTRYFAVIQHDITEQKEREHVLQRAKDAADAANQAKSDFLTNISHELRTPLNSIMGMTQLLLDDALTPKHRELAETVYTSSTNLLEIVNDILDLGKIEANEVTLERIGFHPGSAVAKVVALLKPLASDKWLKLEYLGAPGIPYVLGDSSRLERIVTNLVGNAIKYTDLGSVQVVATFEKVTDENILFKCEVRDTGIGIPEEKHQMIFEKFVQADTSTTRRYGGSGLGLAITKQLVSMMGGHISMESKVGKGSTFRFSIPFDVTDTLHEDVGPQASGKYARAQHGALPVGTIRVLVAEDHALNQLYMQKLLERFGFREITMVETGKAAVEAASRGECDLILMDCHMPEMNGFEATHIIRKTEAGGSGHIPIIAMTANAMTGERDKCLASGMDEYLSKPLDVPLFRGILGQWVHFTEAAPETKDVPEAGLFDLSDIVNLSIMRSFSGGDINVERRFVDVFLTQAEQSLTALRESCTKNNAKAFKESAHALKGSAANIGAQALAAYCADAQNQHASPVAKRIELLHRIEEEYGRVMQVFIDLEMWNVTGGTDS